MTPREAFKHHYRRAREMDVTSYYSDGTSIARGDCRRYGGRQRFWHWRFHEELMWQFEDVARHAEHSPTPVARLYAGVLRGALYSMRYCRWYEPRSFLP